MGNVPVLGGIQLVIAINITYTKDLFLGNLETVRVLGVDGSIGINVLGLAQILASDQETRGSLLDVKLLDVEGVLGGVGLVVSHDLLSGLDGDTHSRDGLLVDEALDGGVDHKLALGVVLGLLLDLDGTVLELLQHLGVGHVLDDGCLVSEVGSALENFNRLGWVLVSRLLNF
jgi:hypothetical protein